MKWYHQILRAPEGGEGAEGGSGSGEGASAGDAGTSLLTAGDTGSGGEGSEAGGPTGGEGHETKPYYIGLYGEDGKINKDNYERLPDHLKDSKGLFEQYDTVEGLLGALKNNKQLASKKGLEPLSPDAPEKVVQERNALMAKLNNVPEDSKGYGFTKPEDYPENIPWNEERTGKYADILHKHNASPELAKELFVAQVEDAKAEASGVDGKASELFAAEETKLKEEYGAKLPEIVQQAVRGLNSMGIMDGDKPVDANHSIFKNAIAVKMAAAYASAVSEDKLVTGAGGSGLNGMSNRDKALDILNNSNNPLYKAYHDPEHPQHEQAVKTRSNFNRLHIESQKG